MLMLSVHRLDRTDRDRSPILGAAALSAVLWAYACGGVTTATPDPPPDPSRATSSTAMSPLALTPAQAPCDGWATWEFWRAVDPATVRGCIAQGYSVDARTTFRNATPLHWAAAESDDHEVVNVLIEAGASLEAVSSDGRTPLHFAARGNGNLEVLRALLRYEPDVYAKNPYDRTPLHLAALWNDNPDIVEELARVTDVNVRATRGETPLHSATRSRGFPTVPDPNPHVVAVLLRRGGRPRGGSGQTGYGMEYPQAVGQRQTCRLDDPGRGNTQGSSTGAVPSVRRDQSGRGHRLAGWTRVSVGAPQETPATIHRRLRGGGPLSRRRLGGCGLS